MFTEKRRSLNLFILAAMLSALFVGVLYPWLNGGPHRIEADAAAAAQDTDIFMMTEYENDYAQGTEKEAFNVVLTVLRDNRTGLGRAEEKRLASVIVGESAAYNLDPLLVLALIKTESTFYNWSRSFKGAVGLMQILPSTGEALARDLNLRWKGDETLLDPYLNVKMGIHYLSTLTERFNNDTRTTLVAYNEGPTGLACRLRKGRQPNGRYANKVLAYYKDFKENTKYY